MTDEQLTSKINAIAKLAFSPIDSDGYRHADGTPTDACHDLRFLLTRIDSLNSQLENKKPLGWFTAPKSRFDLDSGGMSPWGSGINVLTHGQKVEPAMLFIAHWLINGKYRSVQHRHDGSYRAIDEASGDSWSAESLVELVEVMRR